jgi:hypothetical protein
VVSLRYELMVSFQVFSRVGEGQQPRGAPFPFAREKGAGWRGTQAAARKLLPCRAHANPWVVGFRIERVEEGETEQCSDEQLPGIPNSVDG